MVEHDLNLVACRRGGNAHAVLHDSQNFAVRGVELLVPSKVSLGQFAKRRAGRLLAPALPGGAGAGLLFGARGLESGFVKLYPASGQASCMKSFGRP